MSDVLRVGAPYNPNRLRWTEGANYNFRGGEHELLLLFADPANTEIDAVASGEAELALYIDQPAVVLLYRFGRDGAGIPWSDAPYTWHRVPATERVDPDPADKQALLRIVLVDASSGIVRALRLVLLAEAFSGALYDAIREQAAASWDERSFDTKIAALFKAFPESAAMAAAAGHRTKIGAKTGARRDA